MKREPNFNVIAFSSDALYAAYKAGESITEMTRAELYRRMYNDYSTLIFASEDGEFFSIIHSIDQQESEDHFSYTICLSGHLKIGLIKNLDDFFDHFGFSISSYKLLSLELIKLASIKSAPALKKMLSKKG